MSPLNPLRLLNVLKCIKNKSRSYYRTFPNVPENTTRHSVFSNLLRNPTHAHSIASIVIFDNRLKQLLKVVKTSIFDDLKKQTIDLLIFIIQYGFQ